ncbi:MAG: hypothetical protein R2932_30760 [Caldilineaceae bacterium]
MKRKVEYFEADGLAAVALERTLVGGAVTPPVSGTDRYGDRINGLAWCVL